MRSVSRLALSVLMLLAFLPTHAEESDSQAPPEPPPGEGGAGSLTEALQGESGISVQTMCTNCNSADLSVGSFGNDFIAMVADGLPVPAGLAQIYLLSVMPASLIENVTVTKGAGDAALPGGAVGGGIEVRRGLGARGLQLDAATDAGQHGWRSARVNLSGGNAWFSGALAATAAESNEVDDDEDGNPDMAAIDRTTVEGRVELRPGRQRIGLGVTLYDEMQENGRAAYDFLSSGPFFLDRDVWNLENVDLTRNQYDATWEYRWDRGARLEATAMQADRTMLVDETLLVILGTFDPAYDIDERQRHARVSAFVPLGISAAMRAGVSRFEQDYDVVDYKNMNQGTETLTEDGAWVEFERSLPHRINVTAGLRRAEYAYEDAETRAPWLALDLPEGNAWLPRGELSWMATDALRFRLTAGRGRRQPPASYEEVCCGRRYRGNRGVMLETSRVVGLETVWQPTWRYQVSASVFDSRFDQLVFKMVTQSSQAQPLYQNVNMPRARFQSLTVESRLQPADWIDLRLAATWTDTNNDSDGDRVPALLDTGSLNPVPATFVVEDVPYVPDRSASLSVTLTPTGTGLTIDLSAQHSGPRTIQSFDPTVFDPVTGDTLAFVRAPSFEIYNARIAYELPAGVGLFLGVDNIGDYLQTDIADPTTDWTWGPLRGRYVYGGVTYRFATRRR